MAVYCMSDIHGQQEAFHTMLEKIRFSPEDRLYIIGDVVDRGPRGVELLQEIMDAPNMTLLLGNHELMMRQCLGPCPQDWQIDLWSCNHSLPTLSGFLKLPQEERERILSFLDTLPDSLDITVGDSRFFLVHGFPGTNTMEAVWGRPARLDIPQPLPGRQVILGHTPVPLLLNRSPEQQERYFRELERTGGHVQILHAPGFIDLDCGCGHSAPGCALACLRLDDFREFYVPVEIRS